MIDRLFSAAGKLEPLAVIRKRHVRPKLPELRVERTADLLLVSCVAVRTQQTLIDESELHAEKLSGLPAFPEFPQAEQ
jgi:hypothetical protein